MKDAPSFELKVLDERIFEWGLPTYQTEMSAGIDVYACLDSPIELIPQAPPTLIPTGVAILMGDANYVAFLLARSGLGHKKGVVLGQGVGTIDADYADQIFVSTWLRTPPGTENVVINPGDRIAQIVFLQVLRPNLQIVGEFSKKTSRGLGGFGSTGI